MAASSLSCSTTSWLREPCSTSFLAGRNRPAGLRGHRTRPLWDDPLDRHHGADAARSFTSTFPRPEIRPGESILVIGAGGPMGQMHVHPNGVLRESRMCRSSERTWTMPGLDRRIEPRQRVGQRVPSANCSTARNAAQAKGSQSQEQAEEVRRTVQPSAGTDEAGCAPGLLPRIEIPRGGARVLGVPLGTVKSRLHRRHPETWRRLDGCPGIVR